MSLILQRNTIHKVQSVLSSAAPQKVYSRNQFTKKLNKMEAVRSLKHLGYAFNDNGQLRKLDSDGKPSEEHFKFNISSKHQECQAHYEEIGTAITPYIYHLLKQEGMVKLPVPKDSSNGTFIFVTPDYDKKDVLMVLIHGSGVVRAGQWARSLIINENLDTGTQIPYVRKAVKNNYGVMIFNTNDNCTVDGLKIPHSSSAEEHALYVWETYINNVKAESILIVAHSYGGVVTVTLADKMKTDFVDRVKAVAFTDSVHGCSEIKVTKHLKEISKNWISSTKPLDTPLKTPEFDVARVSAGHPKHEMTSHSSLASVFEFFEQQLSRTKNVKIN